jgi:hypothetical protein
MFGDLLLHDGLVIGGRPGAARTIREQVGRIGSLTLIRNLLELPSLGSARGLALDVTQKSAVGLAGFHQSEYVGYLQDLEC